MDPGRRDALKAALAEHDALPSARRAEWLEALAERDPELAAEVWTWVQTPTRKSDGLGLSGIVEAAVAERVQAGQELPLPERIGPYRVIERIGAGGMGVVYRAEQLEPLRREVAIKVLRGGLAPRELLRRFETERRALAVMEHPGIARVLDAGVDDQGSPFVAMELVRGEPITAYCRHRGLGVRERAALFVEVCRAVQHAHQRGVIHRDLKPSNLLVAESDGRPAVKVIDFGIARVMAESGVPGTALTHQGQVIGTLGYMSPEQAEGRIEAVDTRADVYALGAVLYELLTGALPHDLAARSYGDALRTVSTALPVPPRRRPGAARDVDADLEAVVLKALALEPGERYDGPGALADDLERWQKFIIRKDPETPWLAPDTRRLMRNFELVLTSRWPTVQDAQLPAWGRHLLKLLSDWRYRLGVYTYPAELEWAQRFIGLRKPKEESL